MTGLDRIIARILAEAKERAGMILDEAQAECRAAAEQYAAEADKIRDDIIENTEREGEAVIARARSNAAMTRRQILARTKTALIDETFEKAAAEIRSTDGGRYRELLVALLTSALIEEAESAKEGVAFGDEVAEFDSFEVLMNREDRRAWGESVVEDARRAARPRIGAERAAKLRLSAEEANIDGGLLLRYGSIEANCSLSMLLAQMRSVLEPKVSAILFEAERENL